MRWNQVISKDRNGAIPSRYALKLNTCIVNLTVFISIWSVRAQGQSCITALLLLQGDRDQNVQGNKLKKFRSADNFWVSQAMDLLPFVFERHHDNAVRKPVSCQFLGAYLPMLHAFLYFIRSLLFLSFFKRFCVPILITRTCNPIWCDWFIHR